MVHKKNFFTYSRNIRDLSRTPSLCAVNKIVEKSKRKSRTTPSNTNAYLRISLYVNKSEKPYTYCLFFLYKNGTNKRRAKCFTELTYRLGWLYELGYGSFYPLVKQSTITMLAKLVVPEWHLASIRIQEISQKKLKQRNTTRLKCWK